MKKLLSKKTFAAITALLAFFVLPTMVKAQTNEAYAVMDNTAKTLNFYYDTNKASHTEGVVYTLPDSDTGYPEWCLVYDRKAITTVTIDKSMAKFHPVTTRLWFDGFQSLTTINGIENLNTDQVTNMGGMFSGCKVLTSLDVSAFKTDKVTYMDYLFDSCESLKNIDVSKFDTRSATKMCFMFYGCKGLTSLDVSSFNTQLVEDMSDMFHDCEALTIIYCNDTWTCEMSISMFKDCKLLKGGENGSISYDEDKIDITMANPTTGYFSKKGSTNIDFQKAENKSINNGVFTLQGVRLGDALDNIQAGIYIVNGKKVVKR